LTGDGGAGLPDYLLWEFRDADRAPYQFIANGRPAGRSFRSSAPRRPRFDAGAMLGLLVHQAALIEPGGRTG